MRLGNLVCRARAAAAAVATTTRVMESAHPYRDNMDDYTTVQVAGAVSYSIAFDSRTSTEAKYDFIRWGFKRVRHRAYHHLSLVLAQTI